jgi:hypothetical protein
MRSHCFSAAAFVAGALFVAGAAFGVQPARAAILPLDLCKLLPADDVSKTLGHTYAAPQEAVAPPPFPRASAGTDCRYESKDAGTPKLLFRVYTDPSTPAASDLFTRLKQFFSPPTTVYDLGDDAYLDPDHGLHVRKGSVRFYITIDSASASTDKELEDLANQVIGRL